MTKQEAALSYAMRGWKVFPCAANTKIPLAGTHGVKDATDNVDIINDWWRNNPDANIGLACGSVSGFYVIDIDVRPEKQINGFDSIKEAKLTIPPTLYQNTPSGGVHLLYKCEGDKPANKNGFLQGVDIRGDGYYIVATPSIINGKAYEWKNSEASLSEFPKEFKYKKTFADISIPSVCSVEGIPDIERAMAYLAEIPGAVEGVDGHAKLFWVAQVLVNGFHLSDADAEMLMWNEYNPRCMPPWERNSKTEKEFKHKIDEAHRKPNPEAVSIYNSLNNDDFITNFDFDKCIESVKALLAPKVQSISPEKTITKFDAQVNDLLVPEGLVGDIAKWINDTAGCYQPLFALGAALTLCGALFGRKVCDESNGRTNIYCMGVGHSSSGKDYPGDCINKILTSAGAQSLLMGRMTSDAAIEKVLTISPVKMAVLDEVGHFFSTINKAGEGSSYLKTIKPTLMELFSSAHKTYMGKEKASGTAACIDQPCMCIWGVTAPQKFYSGMTIEELQDGWMARNLIFISEERPPYVMKPMADVPEHIVETVKSWYMRTNNLLITGTSGGKARPIIVPMDESARSVFNAYSKKAYEQMLKSNERGEKTEYLWGKAFQNARRIALIVACGKEYECPIIGKYEAEYGCKLIEFLIRNAAQSIAKNVSENKFEEEKMRICHIIQNEGIKGMTQNVLTRKTQWVKDRRSRLEYLNELLESGRIRKTTNPLGAVVWISEESAKELDRMKGVEHNECE